MCLREGKKKTRNPKAGQADENAFLTLGHKRKSHSFLSTLCTIDIIASSMEKKKIFLWVMTLAVVTDL